MKNKYEKNILKILSAAWVEVRRAKIRKISILSLLVE